MAGLDADDCKQFHLLPEWLQINDGGVAVAVLAGSRCSGRTLVVWVLGQPGRLMTTALVTTVALQICIDKQNDHLKKININKAVITVTPLCLQCFDAVGWAAGRAFGL